VATYYLHSSVLAMTGCTPATIQALRLAL
jgi:hypothetical protein